MSTGFVARVCAYCSKPKGTLAFRWKSEAGTQRAYFHPKCFKKFLLSQELSSPDNGTAMPVITTHTGQPSNDSEG